MDFAAMHADCCTDYAYQAVFFEMKCCFLMKKEQGYKKG